MVDDAIDDIKLTEFDSSFATLRRIDGLIITLHNAVLGNVENGKYKYLLLLKRLCLEGYSKFTQGEKTKCDTFIEHLRNTQIKYRENINKPVTGKGTKKYMNSQYSKAWTEITEIAEDFELYLFCCLDAHNMLMKDTQNAINRFRGG